MRIFLALHPQGNGSVPGSMTWYNNLYLPLIDLGHDVHFLNLKDFCIQNSVKFKSVEYKEKLSVSIIPLIKKLNDQKKIDFILTYFTRDHITVDALKEMKSIGIPTANFSCNNTHQFYLVEEISKYFTYNLHSEYDASVKFKNAHATPIWFQMAANPNFYFPKKERKFVSDVSFIGSSYAKRLDYIFDLMTNGINIKCYGPNWLINKPNPDLKFFYKELNRIITLSTLIFYSDKFRRYKKSFELNYYDKQTLLRKEYSENLNYPVSDSEMIEIFRTSRINLGFLEVYKETSVGFETKKHLHLREFEVPMAGGLYATNYSNELAEHYVPEKEVITFVNSEELIDKINFYLQNPSMADKIREAGHIRAIKDHTYHERYRQLFDKIKLS